MFLVMLRVFLRANFIAMKIVTTAPLGASSLPKMTPELTSSRPFATGLVQASEQYLDREERLGSLMHRCRKLWPPR
jgi:hypothetical protein